MRDLTLFNDGWMIEHVAEKVIRNTLLGVKLSPCERSSVEEQAKEAGMSLSDFARHRLLPQQNPAPVVVMEPEVAAAPRTWAEEWSYISMMEQAEAAARFRSLQAGRPLPSGFSRWPVAEKVSWLERNWPL